MKSKTPIIIAGLVVLAAAAFFGVQKSKSEGAYQTFALALDHLAGPGNWSARDHRVGTFDGLLTVTGVTVNLPAAAGAEKNPAAPADQAEADKNESAGQPAEAPNLLAGVLEIAEVEIKNGLDKKSLEDLLAAADWRNRKELPLVDRLVLKGVTLVNDHDGAPGDDILRVNEVRLEEMVWESMALAAAGAEAPAGKAGFLKALRMAGVSYKNAKALLLHDDYAVEYAVDLARAEGLDFTAEPLPGLETLDPSGLISALSGLTVKKAEVQNVAMTLTGIEDQSKATWRLAAGENKNMAGFGQVGEMDLKGFHFEITEPESNLSFTTAMDHLRLTGFDAGEYMRKLMPAIALAAVDPDRAEEAAGRLQTLADFFVSPISLEQGSMNGLEMKLGDFMTVHLAEAAFEGPYIAGAIPVRSKSRAKGLVVTLPADPKAAEGSEAAREAYAFGRDFGVTRFEIDAAGESDYDPKTGVWSNRLTSFIVKDLAQASFAIDLGGMTAERLGALKEIPLASAFMVMLAPENALGDMSLNRFNFKVLDQGLTDRIFKYIVASGGEAMKDVSPEALKTAAAGNLAMLMDIRGRDILANPEVLTKSLTAFLNQPGGLELNLAAEPPLSFKSAQAAAGDLNRILNSLNISLSANGESAPTLKFAVTGFSPGSSPDSNAEGDEFDEEN